MTGPISSTKRIAGGAFFSYISLALDVLMGILYTPWMIGQLGQSDYGVYSLALSVIAMITMDFGIGNAATKYICEYRVRGEKAKINRLLGVTFRLYLLIDIALVLVLLAVWLFMNNIYVQLTPGELGRFKTVFLIAGLCCMLSFPFTPLSGILNAYEKFAQMKLLGIVSRLVMTVLTVIALLSGFGLYALVMINSVVNLALIAFKYRLVRAQTSLRPSLALWDSGLVRAFMSLKYRHISWQTSARLTLYAQDSEIIGRVFGFSIWFTLMVVLKRLTLNFCPSILGIVSTGTDAIAVFNVGRTVYTYAATLTSGLSGLFLLRVTNLESKKDRAESVTSLMTRVGRIQLFLTSFLMLGLLLYGKEFFGLWIGPAYGDAFYVSLLLMLPMLVVSTQEIAGTFIVVQNKVRLLVVIDGVAAAVCVSLCFLFGRRYGAIGAGAAYMAASVLAYIIVSNVIYARVLKLKLRRFFFGCHLKLLPPILIAAAAGYGIRLLVPSGGVLWLVAKAVLYAAAFAAAMWLTGLDDMEKDFVRRTLAKLRGIHLKVRAGRRRR